MKNRYTAPPTAFKNAIDAKRLSAKPESKTFAGKFMYMGDDKNGKHLFKSIVTREYLT